MLDRRPFRAVLWGCAMSLLLNLRAWVGLDEAIEMAISEDIFTNDTIRVEAKQQLLKAYVEHGLPLRLSVSYLAYLGDKSSPSFIRNEDTESHPEVCLDNTLEVCLLEPPCIHGAIFVFDSCFYQKHMAEFGKAYVFNECVFNIKSDCGGLEAVNVSGFRVIEWSNVIEPAEWCKDYFLMLKTESLRELFARARSTTSIPLSSVDQPKELSAKSETCYQNIIGAMLKLLEKDTKCYPARTNVIDSIIDIGGNRAGLSLSHLNRTLPKCIRKFESH